VAVREEGAFFFFLFPLLLFPFFLSFSPEQGVDGEGERQDVRGSARELLVTGVARVLSSFSRSCGFTRAVLDRCKPGISWSGRDPLRDGGAEQGVRGLHRTARTRDKALFSPFFLPPFLPFILTRDGQRAVRRRR